MWNDAVWQVVVRVGFLTRSDCLKLCLVILCTRSTQSKILKTLTRKCLKYSKYNKSFFFNDHHWVVCQGGKHIFTYF